MEKILRAVPGLKNFLCDTENMVVYSHKRGVIRPMMPRGLSKSLSLYDCGKTYVTTLYRVVYCTRNEIDVTKIPSNFCFSFDGKDIRVCERSDIAKLSAETKKKERRLSLEQAEKEFAMIKKYIKGNRNPLLYKMSEIRKEVSLMLRNRFGLTEERSDMYAELGVASVIDRIDRGDEINLGLKRMAYCSARSQFMKDRFSTWEDYKQKYIIAG